MTQQGPVAMRPAAITTDQEYAAACAAQARALHLKADAAAARGKPKCQPQPKGPAMILTLYGRTYAPSRAAVVESLFQGPATHSGTYRLTRSGVILSDLTGQERVFIRKDGLGPVTTFRHDGRRRYMFSTTSRDDAWLGTPESYSATIDGAKAFARALFPA